MINSSPFSFSQIVGRVKRGTNKLLPEAGADGRRRWHIHMAPEGGAEMVLEMETVGWRKIRIKTTMAVDPNDHPTKMKTWSLKDGAFGVPMMHEVLGWALPDFGENQTDKKAAKLAALVADIAMRDATNTGGPVVIELDLMAGHVIDVRDTAHRLLHAAVNRAEKSLPLLPNFAVRAARNVTDMTLGEKLPTLKRKDQDDASRVRLV